MIVLSLQNGRRTYTEKIVMLIISILQMRDSNDFTNSLTIQKIKTKKLYESHLKNIV